MSKQLALITLAAIVILGAFLRFYQIQEIPLGLYSDEAMNGNNALEALETGDFKVFYQENNGREGLFINLQALSLWIFGAEPWALRAVSALFGTLTILGVYLVSRELFQNRAISILASFFLATSFWHINFSRIGFRAILVPFLATFAMYFLLKGLRCRRSLDLVWAGVFAGLGFYTYIAWRFMPFLMLVPLGWYLWQWLQKKLTYCIPCAVLLFLFVAFVVALPLGLYFFQNPQDFLGRATDVSIFSGESPTKEFLKSNLKTVGMFFAPRGGDCNWRHNLDCKPFLPHGILLVITIIVLVRDFFKKTSTLYTLPSTLIITWLFFMSLPATLTREGLPHALRSIGMIPPVMLSSGFATWWLYQKIMGWLDAEKQKRPEVIMQLERIKKEVILLSLLVLLLVPAITFRQYFVRWAYNPNTYFAFSTDIWHLGKFLNALPQDTKKYVVVNLPGVDVRGTPMSAQTVMFATDTFREDERKNKNIEYLMPDQIEQIKLSPGQKTVIALLNGEDRGLINSTKTKLPGLKVKAPADFIILQNY